MKNKIFCILEQGNVVGEELTNKKREIFSTEFSDFYRLNWGGKDDPNAFISCKDITWSEGRSLLYEKVPKNYEYYIFCDDDIEFKAANNECVANIIKELLVTYKPVAATFLDPNSWAFSWNKSKIWNRPVFPIEGFDLQVHIFQKDFADAMFPVIYHGSGRTMWYSQWACAKLFPLKQHCYTTVIVSNSRHEMHVDPLLPQFSDAHKIVWMFNRYIRYGLTKVPFSRRVIIQKNKMLFQENISIESTVFSKDLFNKIYNINNNEYISRISVVNKEYLDRMKYLNIYWKVSLTRLWFFIGFLKGKIQGLLKKFFNS